MVQAPDGCPHIGKRLTSYPDPSEACLAGRDDVLARAGCPWPALGQAVHGTTLGSNLVLERKRRGAALLTTQGFRDVLIVARENRYQVHDLQIDRPAPLIPRRLQALGIPRVILPVPSGPLGPAAIEQVRRAFDEAYAQRYGYGSPGEAVEAVTWKVAAVGAGPRLQLPRIQDRGGLEPARKGRRPVYFPEKGGYVDTPVFGRDALSPGAELRGPAVIEERESTTVLPPGCGARVDGYGSLLVEVAAAH